MKTVHYLICICLVILVITVSVPSISAVRAQEDLTDHLVYLPVVFRPEPALWMGPGGGSVVCLAAHPTDLNVVFAGTLYGGVFKSVDRGLTWTAVNKGLPNLFIDSLAIDSAGETVYAGTHQSGVFKSTDGGESWFAVNNGIAANAVVYTLAVNPSNPNIIFAGTRIEGTFYTGILYRSLDGGMHWENVLEYSDGWVYSLAIDPGNPNYVLAAVHEKGPWISTSNGEKDSWRQTTPPASYSYQLDRWIKGRAVAFDRAGVKAYYSSWHDGLVSYSQNSGQNWWLSSGLGQAHVYPNGISVHPQNGSIVYLADHSHNYNFAGVLIPGSILKSTNSGLTYGTVLPDKISYSVAALAGATETVLAGTYNDGLWRSENGGSTWVRSVQGLNNSRVTGMVFSTNNQVYASTTTGGGIYKSNDGGLTWTEFNTGLGDEQINGLVSHPSNPRILFALTTRAGLRKINLDTENAWHLAAAISSEGSTPLAEMPALYTVEPGEPTGDVFTPGDEAFMLAAEIAALPTSPLLTIIFSLSNPDIAYLGSNGSGVFISYDSGDTWRSAGLSEMAVRSLAVRPGDSARVYAAANEKGCIWVSNNQGTDWVRLNLPDMGLEVFSVATTASDPWAIYAGTSNGIYRYDGSVWTFSGLAGLAVTQLGAHSGNPDILIAGTHSGAYGNKIGQSYWFPLDGQLNGIGTASINFNPDDPRRVYVGTSVRGTLRVRIGN